MRSERRELWKVHWKKYKHLYKGNRMERRNKWRVKWDDQYNMIEIQNKSDQAQA